MRHIEAVENLPVTQSSFAVTKVNARIIVPVLRGKKTIAENVRHLVVDASDTNDPGPP
jgi:hypothetical protein